LYMRYSLIELYQKRLCFGTKRHPALSLEMQNPPSAKIATNLSVNPPPCKRKFFTCEGCEKEGTKHRLVALFARWESTSRRKIRHVDKLSPCRRRFGCDS